VRRQALLYGAGLALLIGGAFPFFWMLSTSLKPSGEIFATPIRSRYGAIRPPSSSTALRSAGSIAGAS